MRNGGQSSAQIIVVARSKLDCAFALDRLGTVTWRYCWQVWVSAACLTAPPGWPGVAVYVVRLDIAAELKKEGARTRTLQDRCPRPLGSRAQQKNWHGQTGALRALS